MKKIALMFVLLACCSVHADEIPTSGLTPAQVQDLKIQAEKMKAHQLQSEQPVEKVKQYVEIGQMVGAAFAGCAKEMNLAVNEFANTPVGRLTMFLVVWKLFAREVMHYGGGALFLVVGLYFWNYYYRRQCIIKSAEYAPFLWVFNRVIKEEYIQDSTESYNRSRISDGRGIMLCVLLGIVFISQIIMWSGA